MVILKFQLSPYFGEQVIEIQPFAKILSLQAQNGVPCFWAYVDEGVMQIPRRVYTFATGQEISSGTQLNYVGTYQIHYLVCHVFIERE